MKKYKIISKDTLCSTNDYLKELLKSSADNKFLCVSAQEQSSGKGQAGNSWHSEKGKNLLFSIVVYPDSLEASKQFFLSKTISLAVIDVLYKIKNGFKIKWPNDIYIENKKIGGILIENTISGNKISRSVVGIGLNINQTKFPDSIPNPTSLNLITSEYFNIDEILNDLSASIQKNISELNNQSFFEINCRYNKYLYQINDFKTYKDSKGIFEGKIIDTDEFGYLIVETKNGDKKKYDFKEIAFLS